MKPQNAFEIFKLLDKSNCGNCGEKTCLAFAGAVFKGQRQIAECPRLDPCIIARYAERGPSPGVPEPEGAAHFRKLKAEIAGIDLAAAAARVGGRYADGRLTLKVLGKDFSVDACGNFFADIHVNPWVAIPFLSYILFGKGSAPIGRWVSFRELTDGRERYALFHKRGEQAMQQVADSYTALFDDMVHLFGGRQVERQFEADISVVLHPLPRVPVMVCYWRAEEGMGSSLNLFFDETADRNLDIGGIFALGVGLAQMFTRIALRHGAGGGAIGPRPERADQ
ncbi:MAG: DUF3786 domain-containing protein [Desulfobacterales bacterium]|jgi:hypothetical protein|nr:DUF3786 domain-containing protein [Desulfobacterales bacterium]